MTGSNANKILTVSYGTFSCTLEGFDDPFDTMRGIAEYFRDLAADDRYFGAEPPTPDVEMLQSIAQRDVQRRVEARVGDAGVALRQVDAADRAPETAEVPAEPVAEPHADTIEDAETLNAGPLTFEDDFLMADEPEDVLTVNPEARASRIEDRVETVAEKLRRIRAVVSRSIEPEEPAGPFSQAPESDHGGGAEPAIKRSRALTETLASIAADLSDDDDVEEGADEGDNLFQPELHGEVEPLAAETSPDAGIHGDTGAEATDSVIADEPTDEIESAEQTAFQEDAEDIAVAMGYDKDDDADSRLIASLVAASRDAEDESENEAATAEVAALNAEDDDEGEDDGHGVDEDDNDDAWMPQSTAVAADLEDQADDLAEDFDDADESPDRSDLVSSLVAADEGEEGAESDDFEPAEPETSAQAAEHVISKPLAPIEEENGDVGRLLLETDNKLAEDDGIRRRRVISQMRAAVAATKADRIFSRILSKEDQDAQEQVAYRADLNRAISKSPEGSKPGNEAKRRPAPLVLVSSQRIDTQQFVDADIRPQRVEKTAPGPVEPSGFKDFAQRMGAVDLPDLLEAAAAYSAFVEGQPHFSRPEIMKRVARVDPALQLSREAGLRSFGQLLRQGKIQKLQRGQFKVTDDTRFNPAQRIAGE